MVVVLLLTLFLALLQVCLWLYSRNVLIAAAADAARYTANADVGEIDAEGRVAAGLRSAVSSRMLNTLRCEGSVSGDLARVHCVMSAPGILGLLDGVWPEIDVVGHAVIEGR